MRQTSVGSTSDISETCHRVVVWGASGHSRVLAEFLPRTGCPIIALFDNNPSVVPPLGGIPVYHGQDGFRHWRIEHSSVSDVRSLVAIGGDRGAARLEIQRWLAESGIEPLKAAIHPTAFVAADAELGLGSQLLALSAVCAGVRLGEACIINTRASVDHESSLGNGVHLAPGATLAGCVTVGDRTLIGVGATVLPRIRIGRDTVIGAGSIVTRDLPDGVIAYGNPARVVRANPSVRPVLR